MPEGQQPRMLSFCLCKATVLDIVRTFGCTEAAELSTDCLPQRLDGALGGLAQQVFELGKRQFDRVQSGLREAT
jgi:hypothetical protein